MGAEVSPPGWLKGSVPEAIRTPNVRELLNQKLSGGLKPLPPTVVRRFGHSPEDINPFCLS